MRPPKIRSPDWTQDQQDKLEQRLISKTIKNQGTERKRGNGYELKPLRISQGLDSKSSFGHCELCNKKRKLVLDHINGWQDEHYYNLQFICTPCHNIKSKEENKMARTVRKSYHDVYPFVKDQETNDPDAHRTVHAGNALRVMQKSDKPEHKEILKKLGVLDDDDEKSLKMCASAIAKCRGVQCKTEESTGRTESTPNTVLGHIIRARRLSVSRRTNAGDTYSISGFDMDQIPRVMQYLKSHA